MIKVTLELPSRVMLRTVNGEAVYWDVEKTPESVLSDILTVGAKTVATNTFNSGGKDATESERLAGLVKKLDAWYRGEFNITERGEAIYTTFKDEVFIPMCIESGMTIKAANDAIRTKVTERLGKDSKATFANYIEATAIETADEFDGDRGAAREAIEAFYSAELDKRRKAHDKAAAKVTVPKLDLSQFRKAKK